MPEDSWNVLSSPWPAKPQDAAHLISRAMAQFWHYQVEALLHLPYMIRSATEPSFTYNKSASLKESREMISQYIFMRGQQAVLSFVCKVTDFQAFTAVVILLLNLLGPHSDKDNYDIQEREMQDRQLVDKVADMLSDPTDAMDSAVVTQGLKVIKTLFAMGRNGGQATGSMKLVIP